eukprot:gnl/TRDRNA2_/TRDRNA2_176137_c0_seq13.p1 gnl/TRDRNA2_/TRDRNA2_176137_c0~~gnl/TRDRNA2_/TRDRNA2_176137_c0_seq13.p1  ORF type:complete len:502 (-),score=94.98 gnl/TRDRNA2_/TRDRNA2_176137_c0_seq13:101-1606(-)
MDTAPWYRREQTSFLASGWHRNDSYQPVLSNFRRLPPKYPLPILSSSSFKETRPAPFSAEAIAKSSVKDTNPAITAVRRIYPAPAVVQRPDQRVFDRMERSAARAARRCTADLDGLVEEDHVSEDERLSDSETVAAPFFEPAFDDEARLADVVAAAPNMERLRLADRRRLSPGFLATIGPSLPRLRELNLRGTRAGDAAVEAFAGSCQELQSLDLSHCLGVSELGPIAQLEQLTELRLARCSRAVTAAFVSSLQALKNLTTLDLSHSPEVTDDSLIELAGGCRLLTWLELANCPLLTDAGILELTTNNPGITHFSVAMNPELNDEGMGRVARTLKRATHLDFTGCQQLQRTLPQHVARFCEFVERVGFASIPDLGDEEVRLLFNRCTRLLYLDISGCQGLTEESLLELSAHSAANFKLRTLCLSHVPNVSDEAVAKLREKFPECNFERHARAHVDPDDLSGVLKKPFAPKPKVKTKKAKGDQKSSGPPKSSGKRKSVKNKR